MKVQLVPLLFAGVAGVLVHAAITNTLFANSSPPPIFTNNAVPIEHLPAGPMRFSVTKVIVEGRKTLVLYDHEMGTEFIADGEATPWLWAATNPAGR